MGISYEIQSHKKNPTKSFIKRLRGILDIWSDFKEGSDTYKCLKFSVIPALCKDHKRIEDKKQRKLESLAEMFVGNGEWVKAHVIRIIVKPTIERVNRWWKNMNLHEKFEAAYKI